MSIQSRWRISKWSPWWVEINSHHCSRKVLAVKAASLHAESIRMAAANLHTVCHHQEAERHRDSLKQQELRVSPDGAICHAHSVEDKRKVLYAIWRCPVPHLFKQRPRPVNHDNHCNAKRSDRLAFVYYEMPTLRQQWGQKSVPD